MTRKTIHELTILSYRVVEEFDDEDKPSLAPVPAAHVYDTTCDEVSQVTRPGLAKCQDVAGRKRRAG